MKITDKDRLDFLNEYVVSLVTTRHEYIITYSRYNTKLPTNISISQDSVEEAIDNAIKAMEGNE